MGNTETCASSNSIVAGLYLGSLNAAENETLLSEQGITHILSVHSNAKPMHEGYTYLCIEAQDVINQDMIQHFKKCITFIHECRLRGGSCLVHCFAGVSRSTTVVVAYLMTVTDYSWEQCFFAVRAARSIVYPNRGFQLQLEHFQKTHLSEYRAWFKSSFGSSPFKDQEHVGALLNQYRG